MIRTTLRFSSGVAFAISATIATYDARGQADDGRIVPKNASEAFFVEKIKNLDELAQKAASTPEQLTRQAAAQELLLFHIDELVRRYPGSASKDRVLIAKLRTLAHLARTSPAHLGRLLAVTDELTQSEPTGELASENAFYAMQAFVLGARREGMPRQRRLQGTIERYHAFLKDYPSSRRAPVIRASLIRSLIAAESVSRALLEFSDLRSRYPDHPATRRAAGEVQRIKAVGRPFRRVLTTSEGGTIRTEDYLGKVLLLYFWESSTTLALEQIPKLIKLYKEHHGQGLEIVGISLDRTQVGARQAIEALKIPWPQYFEPQGSDSDIVIDTGVISVPTCFILDRKGILRSTDPGDRLFTLPQELLAEKRDVPPPAPNAEPTVPKTKNSGGE